MFHRALTYIVERSICLFILSFGKKKKSLTIPFEGLVSHALNPFEFGEREREREVTNSKC